MLKRNLALSMLVLVMLVAGCPIGNPNNPGTGGEWELVWSDEFDGGEIDPTKWTYDIGNGFMSGDQWVNGWGNDELEYYTDDIDNSYIENGALIIKAIEEDILEENPAYPQTTYNYTSAKLKSKGLFSQTYGRYEIRAKIPAGPGLWPAIWMLSENDPYGGWAGSGEIDIMEGWGSDTSKVAGTLHYGAQWPDNVYTGDEYHFSGGDSAEEFHEYALEWTPGEIKWFIDGELYQTQDFWYSQSDIETHTLYDYPAPFDSDFYLIMNLAVGGKFDGDPDGSYSFPKQMEVDYVRVYSWSEPYGPAGERPDGYFYWEQPDPRPTVDDNLIYNGTFDWEESDIPAFDYHVDEAGIEGVANTYMWRSLTASGGAHTISNDSNVLTINITDEGTIGHSNQIIQGGLNLELDGEYTISFDAWSDTAKNIVVKVGAEEERTWTNYSGDQTISLGTTSANHTFDFTMSNESDTLGRIEFNLGQCGTGNIYIDNVRIVKSGTATSRPPLADGNYIYNGTFDVEDAEATGISGVAFTDYWEEFNQWATSVTHSVEAGELKIEVVGVESTNDYNIQLVQKGLTVENGETYTLSFDARATSARTITVLVGTDGSPYTRYGQTTVDLTTSMETYSVDFLMNSATNINSIVQFLLANGSGDYDLFIDNVSLKKSDTVITNPQVSDFTNGTFDTDFTGWDIYEEPGSNFDETIESGEAKLAITSAGSAFWNLQLMQGPFEFKANTTYTLTFSARSTIDRDITVQIQGDGYNPLAEDLSITSTMTEYSYDFSLGENDFMSKLIFFVGNTGSLDTAHDVFFDDVTIEVKP